MKLPYPHLQDHSHKWSWNVNSRCNAGILVISRSPRINMEFIFVRDRLCGLTYIIQHLVAHLSDYMLSWWNIRKNILSRKHLSVWICTTETRLWTSLLPVAPRDFTTLSGHFWLPNIAAKCYKVAEFTLSAPSLLSPPESSLYMYIYTTILYVCLLCLL